MNTAARRLTLPVTTLALLFLGAAYGVEDEPREDKFRQLGELLPTPNAYRTASGAPGHAAAARSTACGARTVASSRTPSSTR